MTAHVTGGNEIIARVLSLAGETLVRVAEAVEKSGVDVMNHAKADHERGFAHSVGRFETQTGALAGNIFTELTEVSERGVEAQVFSTMEYGPHVEFGTMRSRAYPFMGPALNANAQKFRQRVERATRPG